MKIVTFEEKIENPSMDGVFDVPPQEVQKHVEEIRLIDVRQPDEYTGELGHIAGSELLVLDTLPDHLASLPKDQTIVFICRSGARSARAAAFAKMNGFEHVYNMLGGMLLWNELQLPIER